MKLNLKYYKGTDEYSDGDIEDKIIEFIKKYPDDYEQAFEEDCSWPVFYHLSNIRKNVISWYPFKENCSILEVGAGMGAITGELVKKCGKVTSIELSKRRATAILERNKNAKNLEIIVGNFKDIKLTEKYDYILLNGVLEYAALYMDTDNPYVDFINKLKNNLKSDGKILIAIENRMGLKYWCGAGEDHVGIPYEGINGYLKTNFAKTFSKQELSNIADTCQMIANYYYMFPDYKFPQVIYTDASLNKNLFVNYDPYYYRKMSLIIDENKIYEEIYKNKTVPFFANSYFVELSFIQKEPEIEFVKFNNYYRNASNDIFTYYKNNKFYKQVGNIMATKKMQEIVGLNKLLNDSEIEYSKIYQDGDKIYTLPISGVSLEKLLKECYISHNEKEIINIYDKIYEIYKKTSGSVVQFESYNIFDKYNIKLDESELKNMEFYSHVFIDLIPSNLMYENGKIIIFDQEWLEKNTPIEYGMYRSIITVLLRFNDSSELIEKLFERYNINRNIMSTLDSAFLNNLRNEYYDKYACFFNNYTITYSNDIFNEYNDLVAKVDDYKNKYDELLIQNSNLQKNYDNKSLELSSIYNSRTYKYSVKLKKYYNKLHSFTGFKVSDILNRKKKSILYVVQSWVDVNNLNNTSIGGTTLHVLQLINKLRKKYNIYVLTCIDSKFALVTFENNRQKIYDLGIDTITMHYNKYDYNFYNVVSSLVDDLKIDILHINHIIYFPCDLSLISKKVPTIVTLHDYTSICPRYFLIDENAKLCNEATSAKCETCANCSNMNVRNEAINLLLQNANNIIVPDESLELKIKDYYAVDRIQVIPNGIDIDSFTEFKYSDKKVGKIKNIAFIGVINEHKGSKLIKSIIENTKDKNIMYHLFGTSDEDYLIENHDNYICHGLYNQYDLPKLLNDNHIDLVLLLSICPESFSYVLSETILSKTPVIGLDIGAIGSRIKKDKIGIVVDCNSKYNDIIDKYDEVFSIEKYNEYISNMEKGPFTVNEMVEKIENSYKNISNIKNKKYRNVRKSIKKFRQKYNLKVGRK